MSIHIQHDISKTFYVHFLMIPSIYNALFLTLHIYSLMFKETIWVSYRHSVVHDMQNTEIMEYNIQS